MRTVTRHEGVGGRKSDGLLEAAPGWRPQIRPELFERFVVRPRFAVDLSRGHLRYRRRCPNPTDEFRGGRDGVGEIKWAN